MRSRQPYPNCSDLICGPKNLPIILKLALRVDQFPKHGRRRFPGDLTRVTKVPHRVAVAFVLAEDFGDQVLFRAVGVFVSLVRRGKAVQLAQPKRPTTGALWFFGKLKNRQNVGFRPLFSPFPSIAATLIFTERDDPFFPDGETSMKFRMDKTKPATVPE